jgi:O-acetyl-ADP-ribose deacetylase (regulator of RNase III)
MIVNYIKGDIVKLYSEGKVIAHGCNCFHTMGAGVAGQLASKFPVILSTDKAATDYADNKKLGTFSLALALNGGACFNLYTQYEPGPNLDYGALVNCMIELNLQAETLLFKPVIYIPRIGCGIAGGDWDKVSKLIDMFTPDIDLIVVDYEPSPNS